MASSGQKLFRLDLGFDRVLLNIFPAKCDLSIDCQVDQTEPKEGSYRDQYFSYQSSKTFLSWESIPKGTVTSKEQFDALRVFDVWNVNFEGQSQSKAGVFFFPEGERLGAG